MKKVFSGFLLPATFLLIHCGHKTTDESAVKPGFVLSDTMLKRMTTADAVMEPLKNELRFFGKITTDNNKTVEVYPAVGGNVIRVQAELGDYVQKGQVLALIRSTEVAGFEKELQDAESDVVVAQKNVQVAQELFEGKLNAERDVLEAGTNLAKAQAQLGRVQATYRIYHLKPGSVYEVRSPLSGFVIQKNVNADMQLRSDRTDNIFDIAQLDEVWAIANVNESEIEKVAMGMPATVSTISYPDKIFSGKVDKIFNVIDPETKAMKVRVRLENPSFILKPEMRASLALHVQEKKQMLAVPSAAVIFDKGKNFVMVFRDRNKIETRPVDVFRQVGATAYVAAGLQPGEKVITKSPLLIYDALND